MDWVDAPHDAYMQVLSIAVDENQPGRLFAMSGNEWPGRTDYFPKGTSALLFSEDYGAHFQVRPVPFMVNGNGPTRSCGEKLAFADGMLYYASTDEGLFCSPDLGMHWEPIPVPNPHLVFIHADAKRHWILLASTGESKHPLSPRTHSLFLAVNGYDFQPLPMPTWPEEASETPAGFVPYQAAVADEPHGQALYVTLSGSGRPDHHPYASFCCECGGGTHGKLLRYRLRTPDASASCSIPCSYEDLTPAIPTEAGLGGVAVSGSMIYCSTVHEQHNYLYRSMDRGQHFEQVLTPNRTDSMDFDVPYMKPAYNNHRLLIHWMSCLALDPFHPDFLVFNTGTGVFASFSAAREQPHFTSLCRGIEETVHTNIYAPPKGAVKVLDLVGDLGGFAFRDLDNPCENSFADEKNNRYITCLNADYSKSCHLYLVCARGNWTGHTRGGLILSMDDCQHFMRLPMPFHLSAQLDAVCRHIEEPNVNPGWCALSSDGQVILWTLAQFHFRLPMQNAVRTTDYGRSYQPVFVYGENGTPVTNRLHHEIKFFSDRVNPDWFYGFGEKGQIYTSTDGGLHFYQMQTPEDFPKDFYFSGIDSMKHGEIRCEPGRSGSIWMACEEHGLWHLSFDGALLTARRISAPGDVIHCVGLGKGQTEDHPALFVSGIIDGTYGFYKKDRPEAVWIRINNDAQMYGGITSISGDPNAVGRFYVATNARGAFWGEPE
jgi:hypothetical protein